MPNFDDFNLDLQNVKTTNTQASRDYTGTYTAACPPPQSNGCGGGDNTAPGFTTGTCGQSFMSILTLCCCF